MRNNICRLSLMLIFGMIFCPFHQATAAVPTQPATTWTECIHCEKSFVSIGERSLRMDPAGRPHIASGGDRLYHAWNDEQGWHTEVVDSDSRDAYVSLAVDFGGYAHISYSSGNSLRYAWQDSYGWNTQVIESLGDFYSTESSIALDQDGYPHIAYTRPGTEELGYAYQDASGWQITTPYSLYKTRNSPSIASDPFGNLHIAFITNEDQTTLKYARRDSSGWHFSTVDTFNLFGDPSLALDNSGHPHVSYIKVGAEVTLQHAWKHASSWQNETLDLPDITGYPSLAVDSNDFPHIAIRRSVGDFPDNHSVLSYLFKDGSGWHPVQDADSSGATGFFPSIVLDANDHPLIGYLDDGDIRLAYRVDADWHDELVDAGGSPGLDNAIVMDSNDNPHTSYSDGGIFLMYAYKDAAGWRTHVIDSVTLAGWPEFGQSNAIVHTSIALDAQGFPHIAYFVRGDGLIKYAHKDETGWHIEVISINVEPEYGYPSIDLDPNGYPHVSFADYDIYTGGSMFHAYKDAAGWHTEFIDSVGQSSAVNTLRLDSNGYPHIGYWSMAWEIKYAYKDAAGWHPETVESAGFQSVKVNLALNSADLPTLAYIHNYQLKFANKDSTGWHFTVVDNLDYVGGEAHLELDIQDYPHVAYAGCAGYYHTDELLYAYQDAAGWHTQILTNLFCAKTSAVKRVGLGFDSSDRPNVTFFDGNLKYATQVTYTITHMFLPMVTN